LIEPEVKREERRRKKVWRCTFTFRMQGKSIEFNTKRKISEKIGMNSRRTFDGWRDHYSL